MVINKHWLKLHLSFYRRSRIVKFLPQLWRGPEF